MSKYTKAEQEFLDKVAIAFIQGLTFKIGYLSIDDSEEAYTVALELLTERKKLFGDE